MSKTLEQIQGRYQRCSLSAFQTTYRRRHSGDLKRCNNGMNLGYTAVFIVACLNKETKCNNRYFECRNLQSNDATTIECNDFRN